MSRKVFFLTSMFFLIFSCVTVINEFETERKYLSPFNLESSESNIFFKQNKSGKIWVELTSPLLSRAKIICSIKEPTADSFELTVESIKYFANWANGWTSGESEAYGKLLFIKKGSVYECEVIETFELWDVINGEVRYLDYYYREDEGKQKVKNRIDRIISVIRFLKTQDIPKFFTYKRKNSNATFSFKREMKRILFPETLGFYFLRKNMLLPEKFYVDNTADLSTDAADVSNKKFYLGFGKIWRQDYSDKVFPVNLQELRNSGSLWRDFEESLDIFYMFYNIEYYFNNILDGSKFIRVE